MTRRGAPASRDEQLEQLRTRIRALESANADLVEFAHLTAHDLKEPLATIDLFAETLSSVDDGALDSRGRRLLRGIRGGVDQMRLTIDEALAGAEGDRDDDGGEDVDMAVVVDDALRAVAWRLEGKPARVSVGPLPTVPGDRAQLMRLMQNLLANALEFSDGAERPMIAVDAQRQPDTWLFQITDNGSGIAEGDSARLFDRFERGDAGPSQRGLGLGLTISRAVVERHGGHISIQPRPGGGTVVSFTLPAETPRREPVRPLDNRLRGL